MNILIVDDDIEFINFLKNALHWAKFGFEIPLEAYNGKDALKIILQNMPEVIITDICMPYMDGIELIREIRKISKRIKVIVVSCHENFEFAKQAIALKVDYYIVKHTVTKRDLENIISKISSEIIEPSISYQERIILEQNFIEEILDGAMSQVEDILLRAQNMSIKLKVQNIKVLCIFIDDFELDKKDYYIKEITLIKFCIINIFNEIMQKEENIKIFSYSRPFFIIFYYNSDSSIHLPQKIIEKLRNFIDICYDLLKIRTTVCISRRSIKITQLKEEMENLIIMRESSFYRPKDEKGSIITEKREFSSLINKDFYKVMEIRLLSVLNNKDNFGWGKCIEDIVDGIKKDLLNPRDARKVLRKFQTIIEQYAEDELSTDMSNIFITCDTLEGYKRNFLEIQEYLLSKFLGTKTTLLNKHVKKAIKYIENNIANNINCEIMADILNINRSYFSRIFKKQTGLSFSDYLLKIRLHKASHLLEHTDMTIEEITNEIGLENVSYFYKMYKKHTGKTPRQTRKNEK